MAMRGHDPLFSTEDKEELEVVNVVLTSSQVETLDELRLQLRKERRLKVNRSQLVRLILDKVLEQSSPLEVLYGD